MSPSATPPVETPLTGSRVLITGSSAGIGAGLAVALSEMGAVIGVCGRNPEKVDAVLARCQQHSPDSRSWCFDLVAGPIEHFVADVESQLGGIDVLINNAGIPKRRRVDRLVPAEVQAVINLNYVAPVLLTLAILPGMLKRGSGRIVNIASVAGRLGSPGEAAYAASKAALTVWSEASAAELLGRGILVQVLYPGPVDTDIVNFPGEDPPLAARAGIERLSVEEAVRQIIAHMLSANFEAWIPESFHDNYRDKVTDPDRSIRTASAWFDANILGQEST
jgi:NAD(P)-dependent dehydrogenase (short-subunit alcohol dehydrogenase family)